MSKPTSYDLLLEVNKSINRIEDKMDARVTKLEDRVDIVETNTDRIMGKIGIGIFFITSAVTVFVSFVADWFKKNFIK